MIERNLPLKNVPRRLSSFAADGERLELSHKAADRKVFAQGALRAAKWLAASGRKPGVYGMEEVLFG